MNRNVLLIFSLMFCLSLYGCTKSPLDSETEPNRANFSLQMSEGNPTLGNKAIFDNMRLYCFTQGIGSDNPKYPITGDGGSWNSQFSHELYNITRTETTLSTNTAKAGQWDLVMVSGSGAELTPPLSSKKSSESLMYTYNPGVEPDGSRSKAHEIWYRMLRLPTINANANQTTTGAITRNAAMIKVVVDRAVDIDLTSTDHQFKLHNVPDKISWSGTLLRTKPSGGYETTRTDPDTLAAPLTGRFTFMEHTDAGEPNVYKSDTLTFIVPAHRETDFWADNVTPIERPEDTTKHLMHLSVSFVQASGGRFEKQAVIERATRCNGILLVRLKMKDVGLDVNTSVTQWGKHLVSGDLEAHYLNVSASETTVYDGAASRIHFWSNAPKDSVYIEAIGGNNTNINAIFDRIAGEDAANRTYDETKKSGYIDIACLEQISGADPVEIYLKSGSLRRAITVKRQVSPQASKQIATPYIGTFHRWNQVGERLVTWHYRGPWTAYIDDPQSGLVIDRLPSPAFSDGSLYSDGATSAEIGTVTDGATSVSGTNRIYFRVGWKGKRSSATAAPRYATITVKQGTKQSPGTVIQTIYCRQGEKPAAVYVRANSARFSPYNLTSESEQAVSLPVRGGIFTEYPTQGGAHFQWADREYPRYAYVAYPSGGASPPWNNETPYHEIYWTEGNSTPEAEHETCPPGYRRVNDGSTNSNSPPHIVSTELRQSLWANSLAPSATNTLLGYYADGFFDRRTTNASANNVANSAVHTGGTKTAYRGRLFYNETTGASLFFPYAGQRNSGGTLVNTGLKGIYWTSSASVSPSSNSVSAYISTQYSRQAAVSIRCVAE